MRGHGIVLGCAVAAVVAASPAFAATMLDGVKTTEHRYDGSLLFPVAVAAEQQPGDPQRRAIQPAPGDCADDSCHSTELVLKLPAGRGTGTFEFTVTTQPFPADTPDGYADPVAYGVYDAKGRQRGYWAPGYVLPSTERPKHLIEDTRPATAARSVVVSRLEPGRYTLYVFNLGGPTSFEAAVSWRANRPSRPTP